VDIRALAQATSPQDLVEQIQQVVEQKMNGCPSKT
jgi:hypothetical protein